jgi:hypothetical protein
MTWERESEERATREPGESLVDFRRRQDAATDYSAPKSAGGWHDTDDQGNPVCWCGTSAEYINEASDASPEHPCCSAHAKDGYRAIESEESEESEESAPLVNGCNLEACLTYARERIAALESERDALRRAIRAAWDALDRDNVPAAYDALESAEDQS